MSTTTDPYERYDAFTRASLVRFVVRMQGKASFVALFDIFADLPLGGQATDEAIRLFRALLARLVDDGRIRTTGTGTDRRWLPMPADMVDPEPVPAPAYDRLRAPVYVPERDGSLRLGSLDFKRCASRGVRC